MSRFAIIKVACPCCGDNGLSVEDLATGATYHADWLNKLAKHYHGPVCNACADAQATCPRCGDPHDPDSDEAQPVSTGETVCSPDCAERFEDELDAGYIGREHEGTWG